MVAAAARGRILLVEDEALLVEAVCDGLAAEGHRVDTVSRLAEARDHLASGSADVVLLDLGLPDGSGLDLLRELPPAPDGPTVVVLTADATADTAVEALGYGAYDYLTKPFELAALCHRARRALERHASLTDEALRARMRSLSRQRPGPEPRSSAMARLYGQVRRVAAHDLPVLVVGETGVGKEHVCRLLHELSPRASLPFVAVNCAELDRQLLRSELFGHERGAFTGATDRHRGLFELASGGTLFLDEVVEMPQEVQASFLRVLETGRFRRVGGDVEIETRSRIVAATNKDLEAATVEGVFREDLLYRLNAVVLRVPPLRERPEDIEPLARFFLGEISSHQDLTIDLDDDALGALRRYPWPGNVRELRNVVERTAVICGGAKITAADWGLERSSMSRWGVSTLSASPGNARNRNAEAAGNAVEAVGEEADEAPFPTLADVEAAHVRRALEHADGNRTRAARLLGIARSTLLRKLADYEIA